MYWGKRKCREKKKTEDPLYHVGDANWDGDVGDICNRSINIEQSSSTSRCRRRLRRLDKNDI